MKKSTVLVTLITFLLSIQTSVAAPLTSTLKDQQNVSLTIYNSNIGLVKDTRLIDLKSGTHELKFMDVAAKIDPTTVHIKSLTNGAGFDLLEQNYEYDLLNPQKLLEKYVGQKVQLASINPETNREDIEFDSGINFTHTLKGKGFHRTLKKESKHHKITS